MNGDEEFLGELQMAFSRLEPDLRHRDEAQAMHVCELGLKALLSGTYGVGALIMDDEHRVWAEASNAMLDLPFQSAGHAEMRALDRFESLPDEHPAPVALSLLVTLEPCPMCLTRALYAGIGEIVYLVEDNEGGMVHLRDHLPPALRELSQQCRYRQADISEPVRHLAHQLATARLQAHRMLLLKVQGREG